MSRAACLLLAGLAALPLSGSCRPIGAGARETPNSQQSAERLVRCQQAEQARREEDGRALRASQSVFAHRLEDGDADPIADAREAAERGDFRLIRAMTMGGTFAIGLECRMPVGNSGTPPMTLAVRFVSDVPGSCETQGGRDACAVEAAMDRYAPLYNRALAADPRYPHGDLCRPQADRSQLPRPRIADPVDYGFPDLLPTDRPHDLHEAARRGTPAALAALIAARRGSVDEADPWGLSPLAWAVLRHRQAAIEPLLAAGADPLGPGCRPDAPESPLRLALQSGQEALARRMLTPAVRNRLAPWPAGLMRAAAQGGAASLLQTMLSEPHANVRADDFARPGGPPLPPSVVAVIEAQQASLCPPRRFPPGTVAYVIGVYESPQPADMPYGNRPGAVTVRIPATGRPIVLVQASYQPVEWRIVRAPGARVAAIYARGHDMPRVTGELGGARVIANDVNDRCSRLTYRGSTPYRPGDDQRAFAAAVEQLIGVPIRGFQGRYSAADFTLDPGSGQSE